jgi:transposase
MKYKRLNEEDKHQCRSLLLEGKTSKQVAEIMSVSAATINNLRVLFKKEGSIFSKNKSTLKKYKSTKSSKRISTQRQSEDIKYIYNINGTTISFLDKPKSIQIGKNKIIVDYN